MFSFNLSLIVHLQNKYPSDHGFLVLPAQGGADVVQVVPGEIFIHRLCVRDGRDYSEALGLPDRLDLAPIPKETRVKKLVSVNGHDQIALDELAEERKATRKKLALSDGKVPSCFEIAARTLKLDHRSNKKEEAAQITAKMNQIFSPKQQLLIDHKALDAVPALPPGVSPVEVLPEQKPVDIDLTDALGR